MRPACCVVTLVALLDLQGIDRCGQGGAAQQVQKCAEIDIAEFV